MIRLKLILTLAVITALCSCGVKMKQKDVYIGEVHYIIFYDDNSDMAIQVINYSQDSIDMDMYTKYGGAYDRSEQKDAGQK